MQRQKIPVSLAYEALPKPLGYKIKYWVNKTVFTPHHEIVQLLAITDFRQQYFLTLVLMYRCQDSSYYYNDTVEFCDWREEAIWVHVKEFITAYFDAKRSKPLPFSRVSLDNIGNMQACAITGQPELDLLFVKSELYCLQISFPLDLFHKSKIDQA